MNLQYWLSILTIATVTFICIRLFFQECRSGGFFRESLLKIRFNKESGEKAKDFLAYYLWGIFCFSTEVKKELFFYKGFFAFEVLVIVYFIVFSGFYLALMLIGVIALHLFWLILGFGVHSFFEKFIEKERAKIRIQEIELSGKNSRSLSRLNELASRAIFDNFFYNNLVSFIGGFFTNLIACVVLFAVWYAFVF